VKVRGRRTIVFALLLSGLLAGSVTASAPASAETRTEAQMVNLINNARAHYGRHKLSYSTALSRLARAHSKVMADAGTIFHTKNLAGRLSYFSWSVAGENVGMGPSMIALHKAFMASPHHRANILYKSFRRVGVGVIWRNGIAYITEMFLG
jgi:uncharacterized protein YkwD